MKISVLIPCWNEQQTIEACLQSCLHQTRLPDEIVVVNDGSTDNSLKILKKFKNKIKIVNLQKNGGGKSRAQQAALSSVTGDICITLDADTLLDTRFVERIALDFADRKVDAVAGYVKSFQNNWLTALRQLDYLVAQDLHKSAQSHINSMYVIPGCAAAFRMSTFRKKIVFQHDTITEDLDFTYQLHEQNCKILYDKKAIAYTLDPANLYSYIHQVRRWYKGSWQNLLKHKKRPISVARAFETTIVFGEGLVYPILFLIFAIVEPNYAFYYFMLFMAYSLLVGLYGFFSMKRTDLLVYSPFYCILMVINSYLFVEQFVTVCIRKSTDLSWFKPARLFSL